ncbi:V-type proton ATPase subunit E [Linum perenne]
MNDDDAMKQIQKMCRFIRQDAEENANDISVSAENEFNIKKLQLLETEKKKIKQEYQCKKKQLEVLKNAEYSRQLNASRISVRGARDSVVYSSILKAAAEDLLIVSLDHPAYRKLLKDLIVEGLLKLNEPAVLVRCRMKDVHLVESVLNSAKDEYAEKAKVLGLEIQLDHRIHLAPAPTDQNDNHHDNDPSCSGGVVLASQDGRILFDNTLEARLEVAFRENFSKISKLQLSQVAVR